MFRYHPHPMLDVQTQRAEKLTAKNYQYHLPDHWILNPDKLWTIMHDCYVNRVVELVLESGARSVLEIGCGDGFNCGKLADAGLDVAGVDWSENGIAYAKRLVPSGRFLQGDIRDAAFKRQFPRPFDAVILVEVLEHIPPADCASALRTMMSCLKPGGTFVLTTPSINRRNIPNMHYQHFSERMLRELVDEVGGVTVDSLEGYGDVRVERRYYRFARLFDNNIITLKPLRRLLQKQYGDNCVGTPGDRCHGWIMSLRKDLPPRQVWISSRIRSRDGALAAAGR